MNYTEKKAKEFLENEKQFHLGFLPTEQSHPKTAGLSEIINSDTVAGIRMLQSVDQDIVLMAETIFDSSEFASLVNSMVQVLRAGGRVFYSGCGSTGRLSILMEGIWRQFWQEQKNNGIILGELEDLEDRVISVMTGGDRALIRSVENFEDYISFGKQQMFEHDVDSQDMIIAITEGGETSSVIGTAMYALEAGAKVYFVYNNPSNVLCEHIERSRKLITNPDVTCLDLSTGPMAIAGSTRMQATTAEYFVTAVAMEMALSQLFQVCSSREQLSSNDIFPKKKYDYIEAFKALLTDLSTNDSVNTLAEWVCLEQKIYENKGLVTYFSDDYLLDIFTDTTERAPTFMLPPVRRSDDTSSPRSWIFVKNPLLSTEQAWKKVYRRELRGLSWNCEIYKKLGASPNICQSPPPLDSAEILRYQIGCEDDPSRYQNIDSAAILIMMDKESVDTSILLNAFAQLAGKFGKGVIISIGTEQIEIPNKYRLLNFHTPILDSPINLWKHLKLKLILNTVSTATMARMGRIESNWMVYAEATNKKLIDRGTRLISSLTNTDYEYACHELFKTLENIATNTAMIDSPIPPTISTIKRIRQKEIIKNG